ncbi:MAG: MerR family transcriptional regulator [Alistipes sp.]|nr:MerR family transcriptional regulator [Alistipes sp.]
MAEKLFYSMGELAEMFDVKTSLIRHWESQFSILKPKRNKKGNRLFSPQDVENLKVIYHLVKERGMTLEGAKKAMKRRAAGGPDDEMKREAELMTRLRHIRALLVEVREDLKSGEGIVADEEFAAEPADPAETTAPAEAPEAAAPTGMPAAPRRKPVVKIGPEESSDAAESAGDAPAGKTSRPPRRPRRKPDDDDSKELFAFYEQSLF